MKIAVINASPRREGAVSLLVREITDTLTQAGATVDPLCLAALDIRYCTFCMTCYRDPDSPIGRCPQNDDMAWILNALKDADGYVMATQVSSGHANAVFKTFFERCAYTAGSSRGRILWLKGIPVSRFTDRRRYAVTLATAGTIPAWLRRLCDTATREMKELAGCALNAEVIGSLYAGEITFKGLQNRDIRRARALGECLVDTIRRHRPAGREPAAPSRPGEIRV